MASTLLWGFNFMIGSLLALAIRGVVKLLRRSGLMTRQYQNNYLLSRISGLAFDLMIIAGIATIEIADLAGLWIPFLLLAVAGAVVTLFYLRWICKRIYPGYYLEGMLSMYGMMTGTISSGVLLLRELDPDYKTPAANNLVSGSAFAILFGIPLLALIGMAPGSPAMTFAVLGLLVLYFALLLLFLLKAKGKKKPAPK
jgi:ESS family glutamate:Na+ symporter